jgi:hypothetical protein
MHYGGGEPTSSCSAKSYSRHNRSTWAVNRPYRLAPWRLSGAIVMATDTHRRLKNTTASVRFVLEPQPPGIFVDSNTGEILGQFTAVGWFECALLATHPGAESLLIAVITFNVALADTDTPSNGPGGQDCALRAQRFDGTPFDGSFTCDCTLEGSASDSAGDPRCLGGAAASSDSSDMGHDRRVVVFTAVLGVVVGLVAVIAVLVCVARGAPRVSCALVLVRAQSTQPRVSSLGGPSIHRSGCMCTRWCTLSPLAGLHWQVSQPLAREAEETDTRQL